MLLNWIFFFGFLSLALYLKVTDGDFEDVVWALFFAVLVRIIILEDKL